MANILIIEDNKELQTIIRHALSKHDTTSVTLLADALGKLSTQKYDLILLDIGLPDGDGIQFFLKLKNSYDFPQIPAIFLTSHSKTEEIIMGLDLGALDYIAKPFNPFELRARVDSNLKKLSSTKNADIINKIGDIKIDLQKHQVSVVDQLEDMQIQFTPLEYKIFIHFVNHENHVLSRNQIIENIWGNSIHINDRTIDAHISNIRKKLNSKTHSIYSIYATGYSLQKVTEKFKAG